MQDNFCMYHGAGNDTNKNVRKYLGKLKKKLDFSLPFYF